MAYTKHQALLICTIGHLERKARILIGEHAMLPTANQGNPFGFV